MTTSIERAAELAVLVAAAGPLVGHCASPAFWRMSPSGARAIAAMLGVYAIVLVALGFWSPAWLLRALGVAALSWLAALAWYSAPSFGRSRGWPAGSLRPLTLDYWFDRQYFIDASRRHGSPFKASQFVRPIACFVGLNEAFAFLERHDAALGSPAMAFTRFVPGGFLRFMPAARHAATKERLRRAIARDVYEPHLAAARHVFRAELSRMAAAAGAAGVAPRAGIQRAMFAVWMRLYYGIEPDTARYARLKALYKIIDIRNPTGASDRAIREAGTEIAATVTAAVSERPAGAPPSFLSALIGQQADGLDPTVLMNLVYITHTTWADLSGLLQWVLRMLTDHPEWADRLRAHLATDGLDSDGAALSLRIVQETLRLEQSEHLYRVANETIVDGACVIPKGWMLRVCVRESHRDPRVFERPEAFDPDRFARRTYGRTEYSPFGAGGRTACLGEGLSKAIGAVFAEEAVRGRRWRTVVDAPPEYSALRHWRPGSAWRVACDAAV